jgi:hypothetical protein
VTCNLDDQTLTLSYERAGLHRRVTIAASRTGEVTRRGFAYALRLAPGEQWSATFTVTPSSAQRGTNFARRGPRADMDELQSSKSTELAAWLARAPTLRAQDSALARTYRASLGDLGALRMHRGLPSDPKLED